MAKEKELRAFEEKLIAREGVSFKGIAFVVLEQSCAIEIHIKKIESNSETRNVISSLLSLFSSCCTCFIYPFELGIVIMLIDFIDSDFNY